VPGTRAVTAPRPVEDVGDPAAHVLAVDLGTGGPKVAVVGPRGAIVAHAFEPVGLHLLAGGGAEQDPNEWWSAVALAARKVLAESGVPPEHVVGVGCTAQWSGTVAVGDGGEVLAPAVIWMDSRGSAEVRATVRGPVSAFGYDVRKVKRWITRTGGAPSLSGKDPVGHILFLRESAPDVYRRTEVFLEPVDWLNLRLTGRACASFDSITMHWVTDNRDLTSVRYDPVLLEMAHLDGAKLPELVPTGATLGGLCPGAAEELGLVPGTPVVAGTGDLHSAAVGSGAVGDFAGHLYIGTSSWISCHVPFKKTDIPTNIASIPSGLPGKYLVADEHETGGACLTWLRDNVLGDPDLSPPVAPPDLARLNELAAAVAPGAGGVIFTPWLNGERSPVDDHTIRAGFHNLSLSSTRAEMVRSVFEGVAFNSRWLLGAVERFTKHPFGSLAFVGGGASSALWAQIHADVMGRRVRTVADPVLANVRGAGFITLLALGRVRLAEVPSLVAVDREYRPDPDTAPVYDQMAEEFVNLYKRTKGIHKRLNAGRLRVPRRGEGGATGPVPRDDAGGVPAKEGADG